MSQELTIQYYKKRIRNFATRVNEFCIDEGIPCNINNALHYKANMGIGKFWKHLYTAPKLYLAHSKAFLNYRNTLDPDFKDEIITVEEIFNFQQEVNKNKILMNELKTIMKNDFIDYR